MSRRLQRARARYGTACFYCGTSPSTTVDHVIPRARGGRNGSGNLVPACRPCNTIKGPALLWSEWVPPAGPGRVWTTWVDAGHDDPGPPGRPPAPPLPARRTVAAERACGAVSPATGERCGEAAGHDPANPHRSPTHSWTET